MCDQVFNDFLCRCRYLLTSVVVMCGDGFCILRVLTESKQTIQTTHNLTTSCDAIISDQFGSFVH